MIYLASPYSDPDPTVRQQRYEAACAVTAAMLRAGQAVFSPIVHSHPLVAYGLPTDWAFWQRVDGDHLLFCNEVVVLMLDGWDRSTGVREEVRIARELGKPVRYLAPEESAKPRAVSPTVAHVAAARTEADVGPTNARTPRRGEHGATGRTEPLLGGVDRLPEPVPLDAGDHLVLPHLEERPGRGPQFGLAGGVEFVGDGQQPHATPVKVGDRITVYGDPEVIAVEGCRVQVRVVKASAPPPEPVMFPVVTTSRSSSMRSDSD